MRQVIHASRCTEYTDSDQYRHKIGNDAHGGGKSFFCAFDESIIHIYLLTDARRDESDDNHEEEHIGKGGGVKVNLVL